MREKLQKALEDAFDEGVTYGEGVTNPASQQAAREAVAAKVALALLPVVREALIAAYVKGGGFETENEARFWGTKYAEGVLK